MQRAVTAGAAHRRPMAGPESPVEILWAGEGVYPGGRACVYLLRNACSLRKRPSPPHLTILLSETK